LASESGSQTWLGTIFMVAKPWQPNSGSRTWLKTSVSHVPHGRKQSQVHLEPKCMVC
jgi:hypothetical protein